MLSEKLLRAPQSLMQVHAAKDGTDVIRERRLEGRSALLAPRIRARQKTRELQKSRVDVGGGGKDVFHTPFAADRGEGGVGDVGAHGGVEDFGGQARVGDQHVFGGEVAGEGVAERDEVGVCEAGVGFSGGVD